MKETIATLIFILSIIVLWNWFNLWEIRKQLEGEK